MEQLQERVLGIMKYIHKFCAENNIEYFMQSGTLLGAIRHRGFIPWDDDIDIGMTPVNYNKFISLAKKFNDNDKYEMIVPTREDSIYLFPKVVDKTTTFHERQFSDRKYAIGVYVDVFCFRNISEDPKKQLETIRKRTIWFALRKFAMCPKTADTPKRKLMSILGRILGIRFVTKQIQKQDLKYENIETKCCYDPDGMNIKGIILKECITDGVKIFDFEDTKFWGLKRFNDYLTTIYGDYMTSPKNSKDRRTHDFSYLNLNLPYRDYRKG